MKEIGKLNYYGLTICQFETDFGYKFYQLEHPLDVELKELGVNSFDALEVVYADKGANTECVFDLHVLPKLTPYKEDIKLFHKLSKYGPWDMPEEYSNLHNDYFYHFLWHNQAFEINGKWGVCDNTGKLLLSAEYDSCEIMTGLNSQHDGISNEGIIVGKDGKKAYVKDPRYIWRAEWYDDIEPAYCSTDMMVSHRNNKVGLICVDGREMVPCDADIIFNDDQGTFPYRQNGKWGFVFFSHELMDFVATDELYDNFKGWHDFRVLKGRKWGYIDGYGSFVTKKEERTEHFWLIGPYRDLAKEWTEVKPFNGTFPELEIAVGSTIQASEDTDRILKKYKKHLESLTAFDAAEFCFLEDKLRNYEKSLDWSPGIFEKDGKYGIRDINGKILLPAKFDEIKERPSGRYSHYSPAIIRQGKHWGLRSLDKGNRILLRTYFDDIIYRGIMTGYEIIDNEKHGLVDTNGEMLIPWRMDFWVERRDWLLFIIVSDQHIGFYNHYGLYIEPKYEKFIYVYNKIFAKDGDKYEYWELSTGAQSPSCYPLTDSEVIDQINSEGLTHQNVKKWYDEEQKKTKGNGDNVWPSFVKVASDEEIEKIKMAKCHSTI